MAEYIDKVAATTIPTPPKENRVYQTYNLDDVFDAGWHEAQRCISNLPAADVRERVPVGNVMEYSHVKYNPDEFFHHKRQTNADRIRRMSDEELAKWLEGLHYSYCCPKAHNCRPTCLCCWLDWLQQEVNTNDN